MKLTRGILFALVPSCAFWAVAFTALYAGQNPDGRLYAVLVFVFAALGAALTVLLAAAYATRPARPVHNMDAVIQRHTGRDRWDVA